MASKREKIKLESEETQGVFYYSEKNKTKTPGRLALKKYDPVARKHVIFKEKK